MKKTFLSRRNALLAPENLSWGAFALTFAVFALFVRLVVPNLFWSAVAPAFRGADALAAGSSAFFSSFGNAADLSAKNEELLNQNAALANENQALVQKTASLFVLLGSSPKTDTPGIIAGVVARPPASPYDTFVLASGSDADIVVGMEVFGAGGVPLGIVSAVLTGFSRVTLFSSPSMRVDGWVGSTRVPLTIRGSGGGTMSASVARSAGVKAGDAVFVPGPGALPVGSVVRVDSDPSSPSVTLQIQPAVNLFSVAWVELRAAGPSFAAGLSWATSTMP